jgi:hypothetical protein
MPLFHNKRTVFGWHGLHRSRIGPGCTYNSFFAVMKIFPGEFLFTIGVPSTTILMYDVHWTEKTLWCELRHGKWECQLKYGCFGVHGESQSHHVSQVNLFLLLPHGKPRNVLFLENSGNTDACVVQASKYKQVKRLTQVPSPRFWSVTSGRYKCVCCSTASNGIRLNRLHAGSW